MQTIHRGFSLKTVILQNAVYIGRAAAANVAEMVQQKPDAAIGVVFCNSMIPFFKELVRLYREDGVDFSKIRLFHLDGDIDEDSDSEESLSTRMWDDVYQFINVCRSRVYIPSVHSLELARERARSEQLIADAGGLDLLIMDLGLAEKLSLDIPSYMEDSTGLKMSGKPSLIAGVSTVMNARRCLVVGCGTKVSSMAADALEGPVVNGTASFIFKQHEDVTAMLDEAASADLKLKEYYQWVASGCRLPVAAQKEAPVQSASELWATVNVCG